MGAKKGRKGKDTGEELTRVPLQAIVLADCFDTQFHPITIERPKVLLPLVTAPMIEYTLGWLESEGVEEVFVLCYGPPEQMSEVTHYLRNSDSNNGPKFLVTVIELRSAANAGDALRVIYERNVALKKHKERRKNDPKAVMTLVIKQSKPSPITHLSLGTEELFMAIDPKTKELVCYDDKADASKGTVSLDKTSLLHNDKQDCFIDICSPEVLSLFADNFDYEHLRQHFVKGILVDDIMGYKIFTYEIHSSYAARVDNYRSYDTVSQHFLMQKTPTKLEREGTYQASGIECSAKIGPFTDIESDIIVGTHTEISNSVIGEGCMIGSNVSIDGCYIWNKVTIGDGCKLKHAIVCDGVTMEPGAVLEAGVVLSFEVVIKQNSVVPANSKVSLKQPPEQDNDEEWRHSVAPRPAYQLSEMNKFATDELELSDADSNMPPLSEDLEYDFVDDSDNDEDDSAHFEKEVEATFLRAVDENIEENHVILEVNSLRFAYNLDSTHCAGALFSAMMKLALDIPHGSPGELLENVNGVIGKWMIVLVSYLQSLDEEIEVILKFEEMCLESTKEYSTLFAEVLRDVLYDKGILQKDAILTWAAEKKEADESDKVFLKQAENFIQCLNEKTKTKKKIEEEEEE